MHKNKPVYSVVIPVYQSEKMLEELYQRLVKVFIDQIKEPFEIIMVDDASPDNAWDIMISLNKNDKRVKIIQLLTNVGQHNATLCGFNYADGDYVITMDDDLQHLPEEVPVLIKALKNNNKVDVIIGSYINKRHSFFRNIGTICINLLMTRIFNKPYDLKMTSFRIIKREIIESLISIDVDSPRIGNLLLLLTRRIENVPVTHEQRKDGKSGYGLRKLIKDSLDNTLTYSSLPLNFMILIGFCSSVVCFFLALYYLYRFLFIGITVPGWTTVILLLLFFFGITLFSIGMIGEYLIRIMKETRKYPQFIIRNKVV